MKKTYSHILLIIWLSIVQVSYAQSFDKTFDKEEAKNLVAICNYWLNGKVEGIDSTFIDPEYQLHYESKLYKMDNRWQLWQKGEDAMVINLRGTTRESISWLENFYAAMVPAEGELLLPDSQKVNYKFAGDANAAVHVGWTMGIAFLKADILKHIKAANEKGFYNFYITGHSQGAALAHLLRAMIEYLPETELSSKNQFKVYAFAAPKIGNRSFVNDYAYYTSLKNPSYTISNTSDWVTQVPFTVQSPNNVSLPNPLVSFENNEFHLPFFKRIIFKSIYSSLKNPTLKSQKRFRKNLGKQMHLQIEKEVGYFETPEYVEDFAYFPVGVQIILKPWQGKSEDALMQIFWQHFPAHYYFLIEDQL